MEEESEATPARRQSNIRNILEQVKSGHKNKTEAFHELRSILNSSLTRTGDAGAERIPGEEEENEPTQDGGNPGNIEPDAEPGPSGIFSQEDRRTLINKLIEKQRRGDEDEEGDAGPAEPHRSASPNSSISGATRSMTGTHRQAMRNQAAGMRPAVDANPMYANGDRNFEENIVGGSASASRSGYSMNGYDVRGARGGYDEEEEENMAGYEPQYSVGDMYFGDARSNRMVRHEATIREEMFRECTFRPKIKELPLGLYGISKDARSTSRDGPFDDRVMRWKETIDQTSAVKKQQVDRSSSIDCTFRPRMNRNSERAVREIRSQGYDDAMTVGERLFRNSEAVYMMRARAIESELKRERGEEDQQCTFQPQLVTKKFTEVKSKFHLPPKKADSSVLEERIMKNCTFTPKVKGISQSMNSAKVYLSTNVVDRLTRPAGLDSQSYGDFGGDSQSNVMDSSEFVSGGYETPFEGRGRRMSAGQDRRRASSAPRMGGGVRSSAESFYSADTTRSGSMSRGRTRDDMLTAEEIRERDHRFQQFLGRQQQSSLKAKQHAEKIKQTVTPKFKPALCRKSLLMSERHFKGDFLDRVERDVLRRADYEQKVQSAQEYFSSFQPKISKKGMHMKPRSEYEMSKGDSMRRETSRKIMKTRLESEQQAQMTFQPELTNLARRTNSALKLKEDPSFFLHHYKGLQKRKEYMRKKEEKAREDKELADCTFTPETIDCPAYIKRIADSISNLKRSKSSSSIMSPCGRDHGNDKPDWR